MSDFLLRECGVCLEVFQASGDKSPMVMLCCGQSICAEDAASLIESPCPFCREEQTPPPLPNLALMATSVVLSCSQCRKGFESKIRNPVVLTCCGQSICEQCCGSLESCPFQDNHNNAGDGPNPISVVPNRALMYLVESKRQEDNEKKDASAGVLLNVLSSEVRDLLKAGGAQGCREYVKKGVVPDSSTLFKTHLLTRGTYGLILTNKNTVHLSYMSCLVKVGDTERRFTLLHGADKERAFEIVVNQDSSELTVELDCGHFLKSKLGMQEVGSVKYGMILKSLNTF
eukprot:TRINITY_DN3395_c0_g1_i1.p1 TRINITY_DN3395_c0_g1~~TRINITY_DN3395_c0_g1_i1.p1  ORF type:complete len:286 (+),score=48.49 TRINITY_DN3395_c0_g1_i1:675-1532(+)